MKAQTRGSAEAGHLNALKKIADIVERTTIRLWSSSRYTLKGDEGFSFLFSFSICPFLFTNM